MATAFHRSNHPLSRRTALATALGAASLAALPAVARAAPAGAPIKIGIIAETATIYGAGMPKSAQMAVDAINANGGVLGRPLEIVSYDDHISSTVAGQAFQRLASQDKVVAVVGSFVSEIALALEPWAARLKMPFITGGAANQVSEQVHKDYARNKYTFEGWLNSSQLGESVADSAHDLLVEQLHMTTCTIMSENADWTTSLDAAYLEFLPKAGLRVLDHIRFSPDTNDFTPIFEKIEAKAPNAIITGMAHVGVVPTVQWAQRRVPVALYGMSMQANTSTFWKATHGAAEGVVTLTSAASDSKVTPNTVPFAAAYIKRFGALPGYTAYSTYDMVFAIAHAIEREKSTSADAIVTGLEATDFPGTMGRIRFNGREAHFAHTLVHGPDGVRGVMIQWQQGAMKTVWPIAAATAKITFPSFVKLPG